MQEDDVVPEEVEGRGTRLRPDRTLWSAAGAIGPIGRRISSPVIESTSPSRHAAWRDVDIGYDDGVHVNYGRLGRRIRHDRGGRRHRRHHWIEAHDELVLDVVVGPDAVEIEEGYVVDRWINKIEPIEILQAERER
jgi:hypothetical protein